MAVNLPKLLELPFGVLLTEINLPILYSFHDIYHKIDDHIYLFTLWIDGISVYAGLAWVASDQTAEWIFAGCWSDDKVHLHPPDILLPEPGMTEYQRICTFGKQRDPEKFISSVPQQRVVRFANYTYFYRRAEPTEFDYPIGIFIDRRPEKYLQSGHYILNTDNWKRTITHTYIDFKEFSLNGLIGGGWYGGSPLIDLKCFGKPDCVDPNFCYSLAYCDLGLEFSGSTNNCVAYICVHIVSHNHNYSTSSHPLEFQAFSGNFLYDGVVIAPSELQDCHALVKSFNDAKFKRYDTNTYIEEINGERRRTVVFDYREGSLEYIILY
ncbi:MAG TPA: hypothetical protein DD379_27860 [Cyanobacteria bacterium UBA11162]|nr:hypothetical protein [Cyanobacteria bacterium UBA12227]HAX87479.1 hypothetical protein [Cyanobacteria bacterium UBA11370]HBL15140.1 hypothetical protein [Cyanobacteria bacterium UBA11162]HBY79806.1 hypothetical protein [Cyanobacteria bacterium UBA11148]